MKTPTPSASPVRSLQERLSETRSVAESSASVHEALDKLTPFLSELVEFVELQEATIRHQHETLSLLRRHVFPQLQQHLSAICDLPRSAQSSLEILLALAFRLLDSDDGSRQSDTSAFRSPISVSTSLSDRDGAVETVSSGPLVGRPDRPSSEFSQTAIPGVPRKTMAHPLFRRELSPSNDAFEAFIAARFPGQAAHQDAARNDFYAAYESRVSGEGLSAEDLRAIFAVVDDFCRANGTARRTPTT